MSRIGNQSITVPSGVTATLNGREVNIKGPKGTLALTLVDEVDVSIDDGAITVEPAGASEVKGWSTRNEPGAERPDVRKLFDKRKRSMWGMQRTMIANMITGVTSGFEKNLELVGVGYRAEMKGAALKLSLGFSHEVLYQPTDGVKIETPKPTEIKISGPDKQKVGQTAAEIRKYRPPEPYKGKGIKFAGEHIRRKEGKKK